MLRRFARSTVAQGLARSGADRVIRHLSGADKAPLLLGYHRVVKDHAPAVAPGVPSMAIRVSTLEAQLVLMSRRFRFVTLDEIGRRIEDGTGAGFAALTFDDGYVDFYESAFPLLQRLGIPAAVFVVTTLVDNAASFLHDRVYESLAKALGLLGASRVDGLLIANGFKVSALPNDPFKATRTLLNSLDHDSLDRLCATLARENGSAIEASRSLTWDELGQMSRAGLTVGSHTRTHALLTRESAARVLEETSASRLEIEAKLGVPVSHFVYPDGAFNDAAVRAVSKAGYRYAYTGCRHRNTAYPLLTLPRRVLWEGSTLGTLGEFSPAVFSTQLSGVFDFADRCKADHGSSEGQVDPGKRVALVAPSLDVLGGQSIQAAALAEGLVSDGFDVTFIPTNPRFPRGLGWLRKIPMARTVLNQMLYASRLRKLGRSDVAHVFSASYWSFLLAPAPAMLVARTLGRRVVLNYHSGEAADHLAHWGFLIHPWLRLADEIVVPSEYLQDVFAAHGYNARVVRNVVDTARFGYQMRGEAWPRLLSTRNLEPGYRVDVVIDAFARLKKDFPNATLVIAGSGSEETRLRAKAESIGDVTFVGKVAPAAMPQLCDSADLFLNASVVDNQPLSILEAFASGLPVVTTPTGGIARMVRHGETGLIVPPDDPDAMAAAVAFLVRDRALAQRIAGSARQVAESHSWPGVRHEWAAIYAGRTRDRHPRVTESASLPPSAFAPVRTGSIEPVRLKEQSRC